MPLDLEQLARFGFDDCVQGREAIAPAIILGPCAMHLQCMMRLERVEFSFRHLLVPADVAFCEAGSQPGIS